MCRVRSEPGKGSVFIIDVKRAAHQTAPLPDLLERVTKDGETAIVNRSSRTGASILVVDDDPDVRSLLELFLNGENYRTTTAADGRAALDIVAQAQLKPDLILTDYNLPNGINGLELTAKMREQLQRHIPVIILTGDISTDTLRDDCPPGLRAAQQADEVV